MSSNPITQIREGIAEVMAMNKLKLFKQFIKLALVVSSAVMIWQGLIALSNCEGPIVVVLSGSMEPAFFRGDILFLWNAQDHVLEVGDIVVFKIDGRPIPIVHRLVEIHETPEGDARLLTKGDNNPVDDRGLYQPGQLYIGRDQLMGKMHGFLPSLGMITIILTDYPMAKFVVLGCMCLFVLTSKDPNP